MSYTERPKRGRGRPSNKGYEAMYHELCRATLRMMHEHELYELEDHVVQRVKDAITPEEHKAGRPF